MESLYVETPRVCISDKGTAQMDPVNAGLVWRRREKRVDDMMTCTARSGIDSVQLPAPVNYYSCM
jgi:hypothetical protein